MVLVAYFQIITMLLYFIWQITWSHGDEIVKTSQEFLVISSHVGYINWVLESLDQVIVILYLLEYTCSCPAY